MKKQTPKGPKDSEVREMRAEYDFPGGVRGKHAARYAQGTNVVVLDPDVAKAFPDSAAVNEALKALRRSLAEANGHPSATNAAHNYARYRPVRLNECRSESNASRERFDGYNWPQSACTRKRWRCISNDAFLAEKQKLGYNAA